MKNNGFTLIETILYAGLFSLIIGFSILIVYQVLSSEAQNRSRRDVETEADFLMKKITWALNSGQNVSSPATGEISSVLTLNKYGFSNNPISFDVSGGTARMREGGGQYVPITNENVTVNNLVFLHSAAAGSIPESVQISFSVVASTSETIIKASTSLENKVYLPQ
ncbi:MAG: hypothetical protein HY432_00575 [Candidatus Liptonbacteria bacterium]|nr:hypothetical protein [Candidatus Liptonbacteria bacterium]